VPAVAVAFVIAFTVSVSVATFAARLALAVVPATVILAVPQLALAAATTAFLAFFIGFVLGVVAAGSLFVTVRRPSPVTIIIVIFAMTLLTFTETAVVSKSWTQGREATYAVSSGVLSRRGVAAAMGGVSDIGGALGLWV
jgi:hypothetical protein